VSIYQATTKEAAFQAKALFNKAMLRHGKDLHVRVEPRSEYQNGGHPIALAFEAFAHLDYMHRNGFVRLAPGADMAQTLQTIIKNRVAGSNYQIKGPKRKHSPVFEAYHETLLRLINSGGTTSKLSSAIWCPLSMVWCRR
jgi:hypothetical protein